MGVVCAASGNRCVLAARPATQRRPLALGTAGPGCSNPMRPTHGCSRLADSPRRNQNHHLLGPLDGRMWRMCCGRQQTMACLAVRECKLRCWRAMLLALPVGQSIPRRVFAGHRSRLCAGSRLCSLAPLLNIPIAKRQSTRNHSLCNVIAMRAPSHDRDGDCVAPAPDPDRRLGRKLST